MRHRGCKLSTEEFGASDLDHRVDDLAALTRLPAREPG